MTHEMLGVAAQAAENVGPSVAGPTAALYGLGLALIAALSAIVVAWIQRAKPQKPDPTGNITVPTSYIEALKQDTEDEENEKISVQYQRDVLRRGVRLLREWIIKNTSTDPDTIVDDEVRRLL